MARQTQVSRRRFLKRGTAVAGALAAPYLVPSGVLASADRPGAIVRRRTAAAKAMKARALALGMGKMIRSAGFLANDGFSGFSTFGALPYGREFETFLVAPGARHMIMCHPGLADSELGPRDEIAARRPQEYDVLAHRDGLAAMLWRPTRSPGSDACAFAQPVTGP